MNALYEMTLQEEWEGDTTWQAAFKKWIANPSENTNHLVQVLRVYVMKNGLTDQSMSSDSSIFSQAITLVDIGFDNLEVRLTKESIADRVSSLVSDLGGQFGLWLGMSMVQRRKSLPLKCPGNDKSLEILRVLDFFAFPGRSPPPP